MSAPSILVFGFGEPGPLLAKSLEDGTASYVSLSGNFSDLLRPNPALWRSLTKTLEAQQPDLIMWAQNALILWDRLHRALAVNHEPDFLWPLSLELKDGNVLPSETDLFLAVGGFEMSLFGFGHLTRFHHAVRGRALAKLLAVSNLETMTLDDYLHQSWINFESVKAPDAWLIAGDASYALPDLDASSQKFKQHHNQWQMGRVALEARSRNTLAAADVARSNLDMMQDRMESMMQRLPYHGFWPVKAGTARLALPCSGHHPVVQSLIWRGSYCGKSFDLWNALFCNGAYRSVVDTRDDGHAFALLFAAQQPNGKASCLSPSLGSAARAQAAAEANGLTVAIALNGKADADDGIAVIDEKDDALWGKMDLFIPFDAPPQHIQKRGVPDGYLAFTCEADALKLNQVSNLSAVQNASALILLKAERAQTILNGGRA